MSELKLDELLQILGALYVENMLLRKKLAEKPQPPAETK